MKQQNQHLPVCLEINTITKELGLLRTEKINPSSTDILAAAFRNKYLHS